MTQAYASLIENVQTVRRAWVARRVAEGVLLTIAAAGAVLLLVTAVDQLFDLGGFGRLVAAALFWGTLIAGAWRWVVTPRIARHTDDFYAAAVERSLPSLKNRLINAVQLGREAEP